MNFRFDNRFRIILVMAVILITGFVLIGNFYNNQTLTAQSIFLIGGLTIILVLAVTFLGFNNLQKKIDFQSSTDDLTGLLNRRVFRDVVQREQSKARRYERPISLMMIDVDNFKKVNKNYGYQIGDSLLKRLANTFSDNIRAVDIISRWGGEEFMVLLPETDGETAYKVAERIRTTVAGVAMDSISGTVNCTVSIGIISDSKGLIEKNEMIKKADQAMFKAKEAGKNSTFLSN